MKCDCISLPALIFFCLLLPLSSQLSAQRIDSFVLPGYTGLPVDGGGSWFILPFDIDEDDDIDFLVGRSFQYDQIYLNDGRGHFTLASNTEGWQIQGGTHDGVLMDVNGDERDDLILARSPASGRVSTMLDGHEMILLRGTDGTFQEAPGNLPEGEEIEVWSSLLRRFINLGKTNTINYSMGIAAGDFNDDGQSDLVIANGGMNYLIQVDLLKPFGGVGGQWANRDFFAMRDAVLKNNLFLQSDADDNNDGVNNFIDISETSGVGVISDLSTDVVVADFNGDSLDDIFITNFYSLGHAVTHGGVDKYVSKLFLNSKENPGQFTWMQDYFPSELRPSTSVSAGDIDDDGDIDLFITNERRSTGSLPGERSRLYVNDGEGRFEDVTAERLPNLDPQRFSSTFKGIMVDVNDDGRLDLFGAGIHNFLLIQQADRTFADSTSRLPLHAGSRLPYTFHCYGAAFADVNNDKRLDIITADTYEQNRLHVQTEEGRFIDTTQTNLPPDGENSMDAAIGDIDDDGDLDIVTANFGEPHWASVHLNIGENHLGYPHFVDASDLLSDGPKDLRGVVMKDINGDERLDLLFTGYAGGCVYYNAGVGSDGRPQFVDSTNRWLPELRSMDSSNRAFLFDVDDDGDLDLFLPNGRLDSFQPAQNRLYRWDQRSHRFVDATNWLPENNALTTRADVVDLNNDTWLDILAVNNDGSSVLYLSDDPSPPSNVPLYRRVIPEGFLANNSVSAMFGDIDQDEDIDIIEVSNCCVVGVDSAKYFYENLGTFTDDVPDFRAIPYGGRDFQNHDVMLLDITNDGFLDIVTAGRGAARIYVYAPGSGRIVEVTDNLWSINQVSGLALSVNSIVADDMNKDGLPDIYLARDNQDLLFYGAGDPSMSVQASELRDHNLSLHLWPNPVSENLIVEYRLEKQSNVIITLIDTRGREIAVSSEVKESGEYREELGLQRYNLAPGIYFLRIGTERHSLVKEFIVQ